MSLSLKEQLIHLNLQGASYRDCWHYLKAAMTAGFYHQSLDLTDCQGLLDEVREQQAGILVGPHFHFNVTEETMEGLASLSQQVLLIGEAAYPRGWLEIPKPPLLLYYQGNLDCLAHPLISLVGTRAISAQGTRDAQVLTRALCQAGYTCVSGLALGVDATVHQTALATPGGQTIAILPAGWGQCYPRCHVGLMQELATSQLILSEYPPHVGVKKHHFIMRNRLVAGIAPALVVVEAAVKSGSLITANYALQYNREIFVCPGHLSETTSAGCNQLIEAGAQAIYDLPDFLVDLAQLYSCQSDEN